MVQQVHRSSNYSMCAHASWAPSTSWEWVWIGGLVGLALNWRWCELGGGLWAWDRRWGDRRSGMAQHGILSCDWRGLPFSKSSRTTMTHSLPKGMLADIIRGAPLPLPVEEETLFHSQLAELAKAAAFYRTVKHRNFCFGPVIKCQNPFCTCKLSFFILEVKPMEGYLYIIS